MKPENIVFTDVPDWDCESDTEYWRKHNDIALQSLHMALRNLAKIIDVVDAPSLVMISNKVQPMIEELRKSTQRRIDRLNSGIVHGNDN